jgi:hypothetical protein
VDDCRRNSRALDCDLDHWSGGTRTRCSEAGGVSAPFGLGTEGREQSRLGTIPAREAQSVRVWRNWTIPISPCVETFPPGSEVTLFEAPDADGVAPAEGRVAAGVRGDSVALVVQPGNAVFVHIDLAKSAATSVVADITQEP